MPYFVYRIYPNKTLDFIERFDNYRDAKQHTRSLRAQLEQDAAFTYRLIHAKHEREAEKLLTSTREPRPMGEE